MCNRQFIHQYDNLWPYLRDLYQTGVPDRQEGTETRAESAATREHGVAETVEMNHIKEHYYTTHPEVTPTRIIATGPDLKFETDHDRDELDGQRPDALVA